MTDKKDLQIELEFARADERRKCSLLEKAAAKTKSPVEVMTEALPLIGIISSISMIPSPRQRKVAIIKEMSIQFKKQIKEAYAKGKEDLEAEIKFAKPAIDRFDELLRQEAYNRGQADLIEKLKTASCDTRECGVP